MSLKEMTREKYLEFCKRRAIEYAAIGDINNAFTSLASDLDKHPETRDHPALTTMLRLIMTGNLSTPEQTIKFMEGFFN